MAKADKDFPGERRLVEFDQEALIRSIAVSQKPGYMLLLGAGASASSGIPPAGQCIWEWKREVYLSGNPQISPSLFLDVTLPSVQEKIQRWLNQQGKFPPSGDPNEYGFYIEYTYPKSEDRRAYFERRFTGTVPQIGYQLLAILLNSGFFRWVWTTNFDGLLLKARKPDQTRIFKEVGLDTTFRLRDIRDDDTGTCVVYLHGDYRYDRLQNTTKETQELDKELRSHLIEQLRRQPLVVIGYGARDESVMTALEEGVLEKSKDGGLYWCKLRNEKISARVESLIEKARANGYEAQVIEIDGFDDLMVRLARYLYREGHEAEAVEQLLSSVVPERTSFRFPNYLADEDWLKSNAYFVELPRELYQFEVDGISGWKELRESVGSAPIVAGLLRGKVLAVGSPAEINSVFGSRLKSKIERVPLEERDFANPSTVVVSILLEALKRALAHETKLKTKGRAVLWNPSKFNQPRYKNEGYRTFPAVRLSLNRAAGYNFLNLVPDLHVEKEDGSTAEKEAIQEIKRQLLGRQWNEPYHSELEMWRKSFLGSDNSRTFCYPPGMGNGFLFKLSSPPAYARLLIQGRQSAKRRSPRPSEIFDAATLSEPLLVFGSARGHPRPRDAHPIRGVLNDGPYDLQLTREGLVQEIRVGVICPSGHERSLGRYLEKLLLAHSTIETKREYLLAYPSFQQAYRIPLSVPSPGSAEWRVLPGLTLDREDFASGQTEITGAVTREIDALVRVAPLDVIVVFVPRTWASYEVVEDEALRLDLHDFIKAHCAQRGIRVQLLREATLEKAHQCEVLWWLAQAIYVKSFRTPFLLDTDDSETVFVGIGYGYSKATIGSGVVLGCSHIYDAAGQGLRYQVSKIQNPLWRNRNPYLKKEDAIRVGLQTRQLFYETYQKLPRRVVIHKRTPFLKDERDGFAQALKGVDQLEMLTIEIEDAWRFIAYNKSKKQVDSFPVRRGTLLLLDTHQFLLWVAGSCRGFLENDRRYYQGKSRIPVPLKVTRYAGHSSIERVAMEILGLSKMDFNSCDLYAQMPATLESSGAIARIGQLLSRFGPETYDYRLFM